MLLGAVWVLEEGGTAPLLMVLNKVYTTEEVDGAKTTTVNGYRVITPSAVENERQGAAPLSLRVP
eukprot:7756072-Pyramimonas_sp.AAC.1